MTLEQPASPSSPCRGGQLSDCGLFWEAHLPRILERGRDTSIPALSATARFIITGEGGGDWTVRAESGVVLSIERWSSLAPGVTVTIPVEDFIGIARGAVDHREAFFAGRIQVEGDVAFMLWAANLIPVLRDSFPFDPREYRR